MAVVALTDVMVVVIGLVLTEWEAEGWLEWNPLVHLVSLSTNLV